MIPAIWLARPSVSKMWLFVLFLAGEATGILKKTGRLLMAKHVMRSQQSV